MNYPNLSNSAYIAVDIETYDPKLTEFGTGVYRKDGYVLGASISNGEYSEFYGFDHKDITKEESIKNKAYIKDVLNLDIPKVFANALYDTDWLQNFEQMQIKNKWNDILIAEPLIDEHQSKYNLDCLAKKYLNENKQNDELNRFCEINNLKGDARKHLYKMPFQLVRRYGLNDALQTYNIFIQQQKILADQQLNYIYDIEIRGIPLYLLMRKNGMRIDIKKINNAYSILQDIDKRCLKYLIRLSGNSAFNTKSSLHIKKLFDKLCIPYKCKQPTEKMVQKGALIGNPEFGKLHLQNIKHEAADIILKSRHARTLCSYINAYKDMLVGDRIHCSYNILKGDRGGTKTGRLSCSNPNLQQVSKSDEDSVEGENYGQLIRACFIPEKDCFFDSKDLSQIEYRFYAHFGIGESAEKVRYAYKANPKTDFHSEMMRITHINDRRVIKTFNFGVGYGMGIAKMMTTYGWSKEFAEQLKKVYREKAPFIHLTMQDVSKIALNRGYIRTILKRRSRLLDESKAYIMFNHLIQGSAADYFKKACVDAYEKGIFNILYVHNSVHDEINCSNPMTCEGIEASKELVYCLEHAIDLKVPVIAKTELGDSWGTTKEYDLQNNCFY